MAVEIIDCEQGTPEWFAARCGIPTASMFQEILPKSRGANLQRRTYMLQLAAERYLKRPNESFESVYTARGKRMEPEARALYQFSRDVELRQVGFIRNGDMGFSPDSLIIGTGGILEVKSKKPELLIALLLTPPEQFPEEHKPQCQGGLMVGELDYVDIAGYWPDLPLFVRRAGRDEPYIADLKREVDRFNEELEQVVTRLEHYGEPPAALLVPAFVASLQLPAA